MKEEFNIDNDIDVQGQPVMQESPQVALPPVPIPKFDGKIWEWETFWGAFNHSVHSREMDDLYKMNYLLNALQGEAKESVKQYEISRTTYPAVVSYLQEKYGDKQALLDQLLKKLQTTRAISDRLGDQENLCEQLISLVSQLKLKGEHIDNVFLQKQLLGKFSAEVQRHVLRQEQQLPPNTKWSTEDLLTAARAHIRAERKIIHYTQKQTERVIKSNWRTKQSTKTPFTCFYCNKSGHTPKQCQEFQSREERIELIKRQNLCRNCGESGHQATNCSKGACKICHEMGHHTSICKKAIFTKPKQTPQGAGSAKGPQPQEKTKSKSPKKSVTTRTHYVSSAEANNSEPAVDTVLHVGNGKLHSNTLILVGEALVFNPRSQKLEKVHVMLDSGADRSFISEELADRLQLPETDKMVLTINTFGTTTPMKKTCGTTTIQLWDREGMPHSYCVSKIDILTQPIRKSTLTAEDRRFLYENDITLSISPKTSQIRADILLGCADLFTLLEDVGQQRTLPSGLRILPSKLGYLVIGRAETSHSDGQVGMVKSGSRTDLNTLSQDESPTADGISAKTVANTLVDCAKREAQRATLATTATALHETDNSDVLRNNTGSPKQEFMDLSEDNSLKLWEQFYSLESSGVQEFTGPTAIEREVVNNRVWKKFEETIQRKDDGYYVELPWKDDANDLPDNKAMSFKRLEATVTKLQQDPELMQQYHDTFMNQLQLGVIEEVDEYAPTNSKRVHYLAHQAVVTPHKETTKLRVVFDASAHMRNSPSLNDMLHQGPVILPMIFDMLLRFRIGTIAMISDVEKAFLQVRLHDKDRDATRFLWLRNIDKPVATENLVTYRFTRVTFGLNCSPFLLAGTVCHHLRSHEDQHFAQMLKENMYVDNVILTTESTDDALLLYAKAKEVFEELRMNLREFHSNDADFNRRIPETDLSRKSMQKVLGIPWDTAKDELIIMCSYPTKSKCTKRSVSEQVASVYDPHGWLTPLTLHAKLFFQKLWNHHYEWDTALSTQHQAEWQKIQANTNGFEKSISRKVGKLRDAATIVLFSDASSQAMATCAYIVQNGTSELLTGKCKLPRIRDKPTIPKMEFHALTMAVRLAHSICKAIQKKTNVTAVYILTDSEIALSWVKSNEKSAGVFVNNRWKEIRQIVEDLPAMTKFGYIKTTMNPADCATRGLQKEELSQHFWWNGPDFIAKPPEDWSSDYKLFSLPDEETEDNSCVVTISKASAPQPTELLCWERHKNVASCQTSIAYVLRFIKGITSKINESLRTRIEKHIPEITQMSSEPYVTAKEREVALKVLIRNHQQVHVHDSRKNVLKQLKLQKDKDGILRCRGRLDNASLDYETRQPVLIETKTDLAKMIVQQAHTELHCGIAHTMANVRKKYWIPKLRQLTRSVIHACVPCQKMNNLPFTYPEMQDLPQCRVQRTRPFEHVGIDFFGPLSAKESGIMKKVYGLILTCATTRLLHLELTEDMSTTAVLLGLRRFFARRGIPSLIISDNGPSFVLGDEILREAVTSISNDVSLAKTMATKGIVWKTITPYAPWQGAFYERLIKSVKQSLYKVTKGHVLEREVLETLLTEIEGSLNTRPLTYQEERWDDTPILRPIDFIQRDMIITYPLEYTQESNDEEYLPGEGISRLRTRRQTEKALQSSHKFTERFWTIWSREYLTSLREKHQLMINSKQGTAILPKIGNVVLIVEQILPRNSWKMGRITSLRESNDGRTREAEVRLPNGHLIRRPLNLLIPLELEDPPEQNQQNDERKETLKHEKERKDNPEVDTNAICDNQDPKEDAHNSRYNLRPRTRTNATTSAISSATFLLTMMLLTVHGVRSEITTSERDNTTEREIRCIQGGVQLTSSAMRAIRRYEICAENHCLVKEDPPQHENIIFPPEITLHEYHVQWKFHDGSQLTVLDTTCPSSSFCENIRCWICTANILNPECSPQSAIAASALLVYLFVAVLYTLCYVPIVLGKPCRLICSALYATAFIMVRLVKKLWQYCAWQLIRRRQRQNRHQNVEAFLQAPLIAAIILTTTMTHGCQNVDVFSQPTTVCSVSPQGRKICTAETTEILKINSFQQEACIRLLNNKSVVNEIRINWKGLQLECEKQTLLFTRDSQQRVMDSKRCDTMGSCKEGKCADVNESSLIRELEASNQYPGVTYCVESCGGPGCGCFYPSSGCLFYRIYHVPKNDRIYEIFKCAQWKEKVQLWVSSIRQPQKTRYQSMVSLLPTVPANVGNMRMTLSSITIPPTPTLASTFITDGKDIALWKEEEKPSLQCDSKKAAQSLICTVNPHCTCQPAEYTVRCTCTEVNITEIFEKVVENRLPVRRPWISFTQTKENSVMATIPMASTAEILIHLKEKFDKTVSMVSESICKVENSVARGCYSCPQGAEVQISCTTNGDPTMATIQCAEQYFTVPCQQRGALSTLQFSHTTARFYKQCVVTCGTVETSFEITGILQWTRTIHGSVLRVLAGESKVYEEIVFSDFYHIFDVMIHWYKSLALAGAFLLFAIILAYFFLGTCTSKLFSLLLRTISALIQNVGRLLLFITRVFSLLLLKKARGGEKKTL